MAAITPLMRTAMPSARRKPAQGLPSNALPPRRPMKNACTAQRTAAMAVPVTNRPRE